MGIKNINKMLKDLEIDCFCNLPLVSFKEGRVVVDFLNWFFTKLSFAYAACYNRLKDPLDLVPQEEIVKEFYLQVLRFSNRYMDYKVTLIWIDDGVSKDNKTATKIERKNNRQTMRETRDKLREELLKQAPLERDLSLLEKYKKLSLNTAYVTRESTEKIKKFIKAIGMPFIQADDEAENLASSLAVQRKVSAVWSSDTDTYPLGAPLVIKGFENVEGVTCVRTVFTPNILEGLNMDHQEFRDLCILLGTDFNENIFGVGPMKSKILIEKYSDLETIESSTKHNLTMMNYKEVRKQLTPYLTEHTCEDFQVNKNIKLEDIKNFIDAREVDYYYSNLIAMPFSKPVPKN